MDSEHTDITMLLKQLPGIYYQYGSARGEPLWTILSIVASLINSIEEAIDQVPVYFDPDTAPMMSPTPHNDFLTWLAGWVAFTVDKGWVESAETERIDEITERRLRDLIKNAALLYQMRGTPWGLRIMLSALYDINVRIIEWAWPQGMEIGTHSAIGLDTVILEKPDPAQTFIVLWQPTEKQKAVVAPYVDWIEIDYKNTQGGEDVLLSGIYKGGSPLFANLIGRKIRKIGQFINKERPIHTYCYVGMEKPTQAALPKASLAMVIGVESTIGVSIIDEGY